MTLDVVAVLSDEAGRLAHLGVGMHEGVTHFEGEAGHDTLALVAKPARTVPGVLDSRVAPVGR